MVKVCVILLFSVLGCSTVPKNTTKNTTDQQRHPAQECKSDSTIYQKTAAACNEISKNPLQCRTQLRDLKYSLLRGQERGAILSQLFDAPGNTSLNLRLTFWQYVTGRPIKPPFSEQDKTLAGEILAALQSQLPATLPAESESAPPPARQ